MKKHIFCILTGLFLSLSAFAQSFTVDGINYNVISDSSVEVTSGGSYTGDIIIPYSVDYLEREYIVTSIGAWAFRNCTNLTSITLPEGVTSIGEYAFYDCSSLTSITLPDSLNSIGDGAFYGCSGLKGALIIPDGVTSIGEHTTFRGCSSLTSITLPDGVTSIGNEAFRGCSSLTSITLPDSLTSIGSSAFYGCSGLKGALIIPDGVTSIGDWTFNHCSSLTSISLPDGVTSIGEYAFSSCSSLTSITFPESLNSIGGSAFISCSSLTSITLPDSLNSIGDDAFSSCSGLKGALIIPDGVTSIGEYAFRGCSSLTSITIPDGVASIRRGVFSFCSGLTSITILNGVSSIGKSVFSFCSNLTAITLPESLNSIGGSAFSDCSSLTSIILPDSLNSIGDGVFSGCSSLTSIILPDSLNSIGDGVFSGCISLTSITIPEGVTSIGNVAFRGCSNLTSITLPDSLTSIGSSAFYGCSGLKGAFIIPDGVTSIGEGAFRNCSSLTSITIPDGVTSIENDVFSGCISLTSVNIPDGVTSIEAFAFHYCQNIRGILTLGDSLLSIGYYTFYHGPKFDAIVCNSKIPPTINYYTFEYKPNFVIVPQSSVSTYKNASYWSQYNILSEKRVVVENQTEGTLETSIIDKGYGPLSSITHLTVSGDLNEVDFQSIKDNMKALLEVDISNAVLTGNYLPDFAFSNNIILTKITLPNTLEIIGKYAFNNCPNLTDVQIPSSVRTIKSAAFGGCSKLSGKIILPEGLERIENHSFYDCIKLSGPLRLPSTVNHIGSFAFANCSDLSGNLILPDGLKAIEDYTFYYCSNLKGTLSIPSTVEYIGVGAFSETRISGELILPDSLNYLGSSAFYKCSGLTGTVIIPDKIKNIKDATFAECEQIETLVLPKNFQSFSDQSEFGPFQNCKSLSKIVLQSSTPPTGPSNTFEGIPYDCHLSLPKNTYMSYLTSTLFGSFQKVSEIQREYEVMKGESVSLYGTTPIYPVENIRYVWEPGVGLSDSTVAYPVFKADTSRQYKLTVYSNDAVYDVDSVFVQVYPMEIYNANDKELLCGQSIQLDSIQTNYQGEGPLRYQWTPATGLNCDTIPNPVCSSQESISYTLTVTTPKDHSASDTVHVRVYNLPPNPVQGLRAENIDFDQIQLKWQKNDEADIAGYQVIRRSSVQAQDMEIVAMLDVDSIIDSLQIEEAREYSYLVYAIDLEGLKSDSVQVSILSGDATPPDTVRNLSARGLPDQIVLSWDPNTEHDMWKYMVYRQNEMDSLVLIAEVPLDTCSYADNTVINEIVYRYAVTAVDKTDSTRWNPANESPFSELAVAKAVDIYPPAVPNHFTADLIDFKAVLLSWNKNPETDLKGYSLYRKAQEDTTSILLTATLTETSYVDTTGLNYQSCYEYFITATDTVGNESAFTSLSIKTGDAESPAVVSGLEALGMPDSIRISWTANTEADLAYYSIYRGTDSLSLTKFVDVENTMSSYTDKEVINEIVYYYAVTSTDSTDNTQWNPAYESPLSELVQAYALDIVPPAVPVLLEAQASNKRVELKWQAQSEPDLSLFRIYRSTDSLNFSLLDSVSGDTSLYSDTLVENFKSYYYCLSAVDTNRNESQASAVIKAEPFNLPPVITAFSDVVMHNQTEIMVPVYYDLSSSQDPDGGIVDYAWYINDVNVRSTPVLNTEIPQGTNHLKAVITDNDGAKDSVEFKVSIDGGYYTYESIEGQNAGITAIGLDLLFVPQAGGKMQVLNANLEPSFDVTISGEIQSVSSVSQDTVMYLSSSSKTIYCFDKRGISKWSLPLGGDLKATPTIDVYRNRIYVGVSNNNLFAIDRTSGQADWSYRTTSPISQPGVIIGRDHLLIITDNGTAHIFDLTKTPTDQILSPVGTLNLNTTIRTAPAIDKDGFLYVSTTDGRLIKFYFDMNNYTGDILWNLPVGSSFETSPVIANNGNIYMGDTQGILYVMDNLSGQLLWQKDLGSAITSTITINEYGYYYVGTESGEMYAFIDRGQGFGEIIWHYASSSAISNATAFVNDCLLFSNRNGELFKIREILIPTSTRAFPTEPQWGTYQGNYRRSGVQAETSGYTALPAVKTKPVVKQSPSPFSTDFQLEITLSATAPVNIQLMDIFGQIVHFEDLGVLNPGTHQRTIQASNWPAGVYLYQVRIGDGVYSGKIMKR